MSNVEEREVAATMLSATVNKLRDRRLVRIVANRKGSVLELLYQTHVPQQPDIYERDLETSSFYKPNIVWSTPLKKAVL